MQGGTDAEVMKIEFVAEQDVYEPHITLIFKF